MPIPTFPLESIRTRSASAPVASAVCTITRPGTLPAETVPSWNETNEFGQGLRRLHRG